ncbi:hypothetical protein ACHWQZ_G008106 [Mnemiopsis leidyi]
MAMFRKRFFLILTLFLPSFIMGSLKIQPIKADQLNTYRNDEAALGIDGNMSTLAHVLCSRTEILWFRSIFFTEEAERKHETKIFVGSRAKGTKVYCGMMDVVQGKENQAEYTIPCNDTCGDFVELSVLYKNGIHTTEACIHLLEMETYTRQCPGGYSLRNDICEPCSAAEYSAGGGSASCQTCPDGTTSFPGEAAQRQDCLPQIKVQPESATQSSTYNGKVAERAIDGSLSTESHTECAENTLISFNLQFASKYCFRKFRIFPTHLDPSRIINRKRMDGASLVITDNTKGKTEVLFDILDLSGKFEDPYVELRCFPALYGDSVELRVQKNNSLACIHMYEIESYAVELECSEGSVQRNKALKGNALMS